MSDIEEIDGIYYCYGFPFHDEKSAEEFQQMCYKHWRRSNILGLLIAPIVMYLLMMWWYS